MGGAISLNALRAAIDELYALSRLGRGGGGGAGIGEALVFMPGGVTNGNVRAVFPPPTDPFWAIQGPKTIQINDSIVSPAVIPAGDYPTNGALTFVSIANFNNDGAGAVLEFADGATLIPGQAQITFGAWLTVQSVSATTPVITVAANQELNLLGEAFCGIAALGAAPFCRVEAGAFLWFQGGPFCVIGDGAHVALSFDTTATQTGQINVLETFLRADCIGGAGAVQVLAFIDAGTTIGGSIGGAVVSLIDVASQVAFTPAVPDNWKTVPTQTAEALDELAANAAEGKNSSGLAVARPAPTGSGALYFCTDVPAVYLDDPTSSAWTQWAITPAPAGAAASAYTVIGNLALAQVGDVVRARVTTNANSVGNVALISQSLPVGTPWSITLMADFVGGNIRDQYPELGPIVANGAVSGTSNGWGLTAVNANANSGLHGVQIGIGALARIASFNENLAFTTTIVGGTGDGRLHLRLLNDGVMLHMQTSGDGYAWTDWYALPTPVGLTEYGFYLGNDFTSGDAIAAALIYSCNYSGVVPQATLVNATNASPIVYETAAPHPFQSGDWVSVQDVTGNTAANTADAGVNGYDPAAAGSGTSAAVLAVIDATHFSIPAFAGNGPYVSGGVVTLVSR